MMVMMMMMLIVMMDGDDDVDEKRGGVVRLERSTRRLWRFSWSNPDKLAASLEDLREDERMREWREERKIKKTKQHYGN